MGAAQETVNRESKPDYPLKITALKFLFSPYFCDSKFKPVAAKFSKETYLYWYELMQLIRQFELMAEEKYKMEGKIRGFFHAYIGQEAIAAGCMTATRPEDLYITAYRDHGLAIAKGVSVNSCMAEWVKFCTKLLFRRWKDYDFYQTGESEKEIKIIQILIQLFGE